MRSRSFAEIAVGAAVLLVAAGFLLFAVTSSGRTVVSRDGLMLRAKFERIDGINVGSDVRIAGVRVGSVVEARIEPETFLAVVTLRVDGGLRLPTDTSAEITSEGLLGGRFVALVPGGSDRVLANGQQITNTQGAVSLEALLGRFIFSVTELNSGRGGQQPQTPAPEPAPQGAPR
ncbi:MAG TPA: outer membrane lipid asymmetry maintenance protein MlaD [Acetobacteraceae bacterium]|nr:outer membrane lipid asymmetry maintenance protein MlaD [Acetobacteraceae bacterium]